MSVQSNSGESMLLPLPYVVSVILSWWWEESGCNLVGRCEIKSCASEELVIRLSYCAATWLVMLCGSCISRRVKHGSGAWRIKFVTTCMQYCG